MCNKIVSQQTQVRALPAQFKEQIYCLQKS